MNLILRSSSAHESAQPPPESRPHPRTRAAAAGFTLLELLVVIAIIAILAALLLPAMNRTKAFAKSAACKSNLKQIATALSLYLDEFGNYPPYLSPDTIVLNGPNVIWWNDILLPYSGGNSTAFSCPEPSNPDAILKVGSSDYMEYKPDAAHTKRWNNENEPHPENWGLPIPSS